MKSRTSFTIAAVLLLGLLALPTLGASAAIDPPAGITVETVSSFQIPVDHNATMQLLQFTFNPGTGFIMYHHPGPAIVSVVSGELTTSVADPDALLVRQGTNSMISVEPGKNYILGPGDNITYDAATTGDLLQDNGNSSLVLTVSLLVQEGQSNLTLEPATSFLSPAGPCIACH